VAEKWTLRRIFGSKEEVMGSCRKLHNEEIHNYTLSIIRQIKSTKMKQVDCVKRIRAISNAKEKKY
jgi:hypothetical protein